MPAKKEYFAYRYIIKITRTVRGKRPQSSELGEFFPNWKRAQAFVVGQANKRAAEARQAAKKAAKLSAKAEAHLKAAKALQPMVQQNLELE